MAIIRDKNYEHLMFSTDTLKVTNRLIEAQAYLRSDTRDWEKPFEQLSVVHYCPHYELVTLLASREGESEFYQFDLKPKNVNRDDILTMLGEINEKPDVYIYKNHHRV